jgi:hypothetical protein
LSEAEEFLKLRVEEQMPCSEITELFHDEVSSNYSCSERLDHTITTLDKLGEMSMLVEECISFCVGDRVM